MILLQDKEGKTIYRWVYGDYVDIDRERNDYRSKTTTTILMERV